MTSSTTPQRDILIVDALADLDAGIYSSLRAAARAYHIPESTLRHRRNHPESSHIRAGEDRRLLTSIQEDLLTTFILNCEGVGHPVTFTQLRELVTLISIESGGNPCGHN